MGKGLYTGYWFFGFFRHLAEELDRLP